MSKKRLLDEDDVRSLTHSEIDEVFDSQSSTCTNPDCDEDCDGDGIPDNYEGDITDEDIDNILNS